MLGGSFWIAGLRNIMGAGLMMSVFLLLDRPKLSMKKTVWYYIIFALLLVLLYGFWYLADHVGYVRFAGMVSFLVVGAFLIFMSADTIYLSFYKLTLGFYLMSVTVFCGVDVSRIWFNGSIWADIETRIVIETAMLYVIIFKVRKSFHEGIDYLREEMNFFSMITVLLSILIAAFMALWPSAYRFSMLHVVRTIVLFFMAGIIQYMVFKVYLHKGRERHYQVEKEFLETNERLIRRQMELMSDSKEELARVRHDIRHHCLLIEEYIRKEENNKLLAYVKQYKEDVESVAEREYICGNETINSILSVYIKQAKKEKIEVSMLVRAEGEIAVRDVDLVAVIANIFENAIHGCLASGKPKPKIHISLTRKGKKMVILCRNTCAENIKMINGVPKPYMGNGVGISSVLKVVSYYNGESEFIVEVGMFIARILLNIPG